jgi:hypothetical protein
MMSLIECASWMNAMIRMCALHFGHSRGLMCGLAQMRYVKCHTQSLYSTISDAPLRHLPGVRDD